MSASITITIPELASIEAKFAALAEGHADLSPLMDRIGMAMETTTTERFEREEAPDGSKWKPSIRAREEGGKTLQKSSRLARSITHLAGRDQVEIGTNVIYAGIHQTGGTIRAKDGGKLKFKLPGGLGFVSVAQVIIPQREFLGVSAEDREEIEGQYDDYVMELAA